MAPRGIAKPEQPIEEGFEFTESLLPAERVNRGEKIVERTRLLWRHRTFVSRVTAAGLVLSVLVALLLPVRYTSVARLMPPDQDSGTGTGLKMLAALAGKAGGAFGGIGADLLGLKTSGDLFLGILKSRTVEDHIVSKFDLRKVYGTGKAWEGARKQLESRTTVAQDRKSGIITIEVQDHSSLRAQAVAQEYVLQLNEVVSNLNTSAAHRERVFLEDRLKGIQQDLDSAQRDFGQFASKNTTLDIKDQGKAMLEAGATLAGQLIATETELQGLRQIYADGNVRVRAAEARAQELRRQLQKLGGPSSAEMPPGADQGMLYPPIRELPLLGVTYADLYRRVKVQEAVFEVLTQQYELAKVEEAKETLSVKVLDAPDLPGKKSFPPRTAIVLIGTILAGALACGIVIGDARWQNTDPRHPGKILVQEIFTAARARWRSWSAARNKSQI